MSLRKYNKTIAMNNIIEYKEIHPPIEREKCLNIYLIHFSTRILLEFIISKTSPTKLFNISLSLIKALFVISLNLQSHLEVISSRLIDS